MSSCTFNIGRSEAGKRFTTGGSCSLRGRIFTFDLDRNRQEEENTTLQGLVAAHILHIRPPSDTACLINVVSFL